MPSLVPNRLGTPQLVSEMKIAATTLLLFFTVFLFGQSSAVVKDKNIGINYFGELAFRPGIEADYGLNLWTRASGKKQINIQQLNLRPSLVYYHYPHYSNNFLLSVKLNYQLRFVNQENGKYWFVEPFVRVGYLRYFFSGEVFETQNNEFTAVKLRGSDSLVFGGAFDVGGWISKRFDWIFGFDYFAEATEDDLLLHRFAVKLGTRIKLHSK